MIKEIDAYTIQNEPIASIDLMERASQTLTSAIADTWDTQTSFVAFAGSGNNGGDALAVSRLLIQQGYKVSVYLINTKGQLSADCEVNKQRLLQMADIDFHEITSQFTPPKLSADSVVIDGLFGSGLNKPLSGGFAAVVKYINASQAQVVSIDMPSGLMGEDNSGNNRDCIIRADVTLTLGLPKLAFLFAENQEFIGRLELLDIGLSNEAIEEMDTDFSMLEQEDVQYTMKTRSRFAHKGDFGKALLIAGSLGMAGASVLAAKACLRSGVGLLTVHVPFCNNQIVQTAVAEATTEIDDNDTCFANSSDTDGYQAIGVGPGLGQHTLTETALLQQIDDCDVPMVIDADALNILARNKHYINRLPKGSILTPHPKELERIVGKCNDSYERLMKASELAQQSGTYIILKGAFSAIVTPYNRFYFNSTGNPGMATGGSGDVLTGIVLALLAQGYTALDAACLATFVHGLAGDMACSKRSMMGMTAADIVDYLPLAWKMMENGE